MEDLIKQANEYIAENKAKVNEEFRLNYHLMPPIGWMNDPNGFSLYKDQYHLFYQHYPYDSKWNDMHWGHGVTDDFVNWENVQVALAPDMVYDHKGCFSGTALVEDDVLTLMYTCVNGKKGEIQEQAIASSLDGTHFTKYNENPVVPSAKLPEGIYRGDFRDPKIFKDKDLYYCIAVAKDKDHGGRVLLFSSKDKKEWDYIRDILPVELDLGTMYECPDFFQLENKDILFLSIIELKREDYRFVNKQSPVYLVGRFMGDKELQIDSIEEIDMGFDFYAHQTVLTKDDRRVMTAWMQAWEESIPTHELGHGWAGAMILPRELELKGNVLYQKPVREIENYRSNEISYENMVLTEDMGCISYDHIHGKSIELYVEADVSSAGEFNIHLMKSQGEECLLTYECESQTICFSREGCGYEIKLNNFNKEPYRRFDLPLQENILKARIFIDTCSVEIFLQEGERTITSMVYPIKKDYGAAFSSKGKVRINHIKKWDLLKGI